MATHRQHLETNVTYFVTFTCYKWLPLFEITNTYKTVYNWFSIIQSKGAQVVGYVIMPNHVHCLIHMNNAELNLNTLVGNGKRFIAYKIVETLKTQKKEDILTILKDGVQAKERVKGKKHQVFKLSFDAKICLDEKMLEQKLDYIHSNPVQGKWSLTNDFTNYAHSSAGFYEKGETGKVSITHYKDIG